MVPLAIEKDGQPGRLVTYQLPAASNQLPAQKSGSRKLEAGSYTLNEVPQPHDALAFGLLKMKPLLTRLVS